MLRPYHFIPSCITIYSFIPPSTILGQLLW